MSCWQSTQSCATGESWPPAAIGPDDGECCTRASIGEEVALERDRAVGRKQRLRGSLSAQKRWWCSIAIALPFCRTDERDLYI